jgi:hypothetical protein
MPVAATLGFAVFIAASFLVGFMMPPPRDLHTERRKQWNRGSRVVPNKSYPMGAKGMYQQVCECY